MKEDTELKKVIRETPKGPALSLAWTFGCRTGENVVLARCWGVLSKDGGHKGVAPGDGTWAWRPRPGDSPPGKAGLLLLTYGGVTPCPLHPKGLAPWTAEDFALPSIFLPHQHPRHLSFRNSYFPHSWF